MTEEELYYFRQWFAAFTGSFHTDDEEDQRNIALKKVHTENVYRNIVSISKTLSLPDDRIRLAAAVALFHDLGRFPQYKQYRTFDDSVSVNHGRLGAEILMHEEVLKRLPEDEQQYIIESVKYHNALTLPALKERDVLFFLKLVRDADKLDGFRILMEYYEDRGSDQASAVALGLPDVPGYSEGVLSKLGSKKLITYSELSSLNDFKLLNLSWCYLLNFQHSYRILHERAYVQRIVNHLPETEDIERAVLSVQKHVEDRLQEEAG